MDVSNIPLFGLADQRLAWLDQRLSLLSSNVANADTPGFHSRDLVPFEKVLAGLGMTISPARTNIRHMTGTLPGGLPATLADNEERAPDGNSVSLETEMMRLSETDASQELVGELVHKYMGMMKTAVGK